MGRLPTLARYAPGTAVRPQLLSRSKQKEWCVAAAVFLVPLTGCEGDKPKVTVTNERSQAIIGSPSSTTATVQPAASMLGVDPAAPKQPRLLCGGRLGKAGPELPTDQPARRVAAGERDLPEQIKAYGHFTWINFWAAWCVPCKEEIPRLLAWEKKLNNAGIMFKLAFLSLDDDERQLTAFLDQQPATGLRRTYWLPDGTKRTDWLKAVGVRANAELPVQLLLDRAGHIRCTIGGAVEDSDYDQLRGLLSGAD
jgi:thiol-disulfide isomerase/thioredoxin